MRTHAQPRTVVHVFICVRARSPQASKLWLHDSFVRKAQSSPKYVCSRLRARSLIVIIDNNSTQQHFLLWTSFLQLRVWFSRFLTVCFSSRGLFHGCDFYLTIYSLFVSFSCFGFWLYLCLFCNSRRRRPPGCIPTWMKKRRNYLENNQAL